MDIAIVVLPTSFYNNRKLFRLSEPNILEDILVMGYPPTGVFDSAADVNNAVLIAERASIAHRYLKSTKGQNVGYRMLPSTKIDYFLISARVKGGNSGGPVINKHGEVVGLITQVLTKGDSSADESLDHLGFGFAIPSESIFKFCSSVFSSSGEIPFKKLIPVTDDIGFELENTP